MKPVVLNPKQSYVMSLLEHPKGPSQILYGGAAGGAKSFTGCFWLHKLALMYPGTRLLMGRAVLKRLKKTTLVTFRDVGKKLGILEGAHYKINLQDGYIKYINETVIELVDLDWMPSDPNYDRLGSLEIMAAFVDEVAEITQRCKDVLSVRINRYQNKELGVKGRLLMTCNPSHNWLFREFYKPWKDNCLPEYKTFVPSTALDNKANLTDEYIKSLMRLPPIDYERLFKGNWEFTTDETQLCNAAKIAELFTNTFVLDNEFKEKFLTCDIAMEGSDSFVIKYWEGWSVKEIWSIPKATGKGVETTIENIAREKSVPRGNIIYDADGVGAYLGSYLVGAKAFHNGGSPIERLSGSDMIKEAYPNLKTQCGYELAKKINANEIYIQCDDKEHAEKICEELAWLRRDKVDRDDKLFLLKKEDIRTGLGRSPDFLDSMLMRIWFQLDRERDREVIGSATDDLIMGQGSYYMDDDYGVTNGY